MSCILTRDTPAPVHRVMSLNDPTSKMSKSHKSEKSRILLTDTPDQIRSKVASALTDSMPGFTYEPDARPGVSNLLDIFSIFDPEGRTATQLATEYHDVAPKEFKSMIADALIQGLSGIRGRYLEILNSDSAYLDRVERHGASKARKSAEDTMQIVRSAVGL
jgi:tryptophanyl-tRNA synthetase